MSDSPSSDSALVQKRKLSDLDGDEMIVAGDLYELVNIPLESAYELMDRENNPLPSVKIGKDVRDSTGKIVRRGVRKIVVRHFRDWLDRQAGITP